MYEMQRGFVEISISTEISMDSLLVYHAIEHFDSFVNRWCPEQKEVQGNFTLYIHTFYENSFI